MLRETKFGYGFLLVGTGVPYLIDKVLGLSYAIVLSVACVISGGAFLLAGHRHKEAVVRPRKIRELLAFGAALSTLIALASIGIFRIMPKGEIAENAKPNKPTPETTVEHPNSLPPKHVPELAHIRIKSINLMPIVENSPLELKVSYENDGAQDTEFRLHYGNALKPIPEDVRERKKLEDELFRELIRTMTSKNPLTMLPTHREMEDTLKCQFPQEVVNDFKAGKRGLVAMGRIQYHDSGVWNHSDYCVVFKFGESQPLSCVWHNEEPYKH